MGVYYDWIRFGGVCGSRILADGVFEGAGEVPCITDVDGEDGVNVRHRRYDRVIPLIHSLRVPGCFIAEFDSNYSFQTPCLDFACDEAETSFREG